MANGVYNRERVPLAGYVDDLRNLVGESLEGLSNIADKNRSTIKSHYSSFLQAQKPQMPPLLQEIKVKEKEGIPVPAAEVNENTGQLGDTIAVPKGTTEEEEEVYKQQFTNLLASLEPMQRFAGDSAQPVVEDKEGILRQLALAEAEKEFQSANRMDLSPLAAWYEKEFRKPSGYIPPKKEKGRTLDIIAEIAQTRGEKEKLGQRQKEAELRYARNIMKQREEEEEPIEFDLKDIEDTEDVFQDTIGRIYQSPYINKQEYPTSTEFTAKILKDAGGNLANVPEVLRDMERNLIEFQKKIAANRPEEKEEKNWLSYIFGD